MNPFSQGMNYATAAPGPGAPSAPPGVGFRAMPLPAAPPAPSGPANPWQDWSFNSPTGGYDNSPNQTPTPYMNPSPGQYGGAPIDPQNPYAGTPNEVLGRFLAANGAGRDNPYDPAKGWLNDATNPNLSSGDITRLNRGGPGFMGNGYYINDPSSYRMPQADAMRLAYQQMFQGQDPAAQQQFRGQQGQLANSLLGTISGSTPSVAQQQLQQTTQNNVANAYAMAQSGHNNPGAARMAAQNAGAINQQAAGQGALLRAQEIQGAQGMLGGVLGGARQQDLGANQMGLQALGGLSNVNQQILQSQENLQSQQQNAFYGTAGHSIGSQILGAASAAGSAALSSLAHGGEVGGETHAYGGMVPGSHNKGGQVMGNTLCPGCGRMKSDCVCDRMSAGGMVSRCYACGGMVPGYAPGGAVDSTANDTVPALLSPGEVVLPRSVTKAKNAPERAKAFVEAIRAKKKKAA